ERKAQVPADREQDHLRLKLAPLEQSGNRWGEEHRPSLSGQTSKLATLPAKVSKKQIAEINIRPDSFHGEWNYTIRLNSIVTRYTYFMTIPYEGRSWRGFHHHLVMSAI